MRLLPAILLLALPLAAQPVLRLGPELAARCGAESVPAKGDESALRAELPESAGDWRDGTLLFEIRASRRIGHIPQGRARAFPLLGCPGLRVTLEETVSGPRFVVRPPGTGAKPSTVCLFAWLAPEEWHHLAVSWKASTGDVDICVNGWAQQRMRLPPWQPDTKGGAVLLGGGKDAPFRVRDPELRAWHMGEAQVRAALRGRALPDASDGVRRGLDAPLDISGLRLEPLFVADLGGPLPIVHEDDLCEGEKRVREPEPGQWVLEGPARAFVKDGQLVLDNLAESGSAHAVLWLPRPFPADLLIEYEITIEQPDEGLAILFCAARPRDDPEGSIHRIGLPRRNGVFGTYIKGEIDSYHVSYLSSGERDSAIPGPRRTANVRKNSGFWLVACGDDQIQGRGYGRMPHRVRLLRLGNEIWAEANGRLSVHFADDGKTYGPVLGGGYVGLRQMNHILSASYRNLRVFAVERRQ